MATNTQNQHVSTFIKGMDTDTSDMVLGADKYRYAENIRIVTNQDSNTGEVRLIEGCLKQFDINDIKDILFNKQPAHYSKSWKIRESTEIRQYGILIIESSEDDKSWFVVRYNKDKSDDNANPWAIKIVFGVCSELLGESKLSLVTNYEDDDNIKLYIADAEHKLMSINIAGNIVYNTISDITNETDFEDLKQITDITIIDGILPAGRILYCYQLYNRNGTITKISPLSIPLSTNKHEWRWTGVEQNLLSTTGFKITVYLLQNYNYIKLYRIVFTDATSLPTCELILDSHYDYNNQQSMSISDYGLAALLVVDMSEIANIQYYQLIPKIIESKNNRLFASNVKYPTSRNFIDWDARSYSDGSYFNGSSENKIITHTGEDISLKTVPTNANVENDNQDLASSYNRDSWKVNEDWDGVGTNINWKYETKSVNVDTQINMRFIRKPGYEEVVKILNSFRRDEIYRFAIVLYDDAGFEYPAKWIADIRMPDAKNSKIFKLSGKLLKANYLYIKFYIKNLPESCVKFNIVRCKLTIKDRATLTQGVLSNTVGYVTGSVTENNRCPSGIISLQHQIYPWRLVDGSMDYIIGQEVSGTRENLYLIDPDDRNVLRWEIVGHSKNDVFQLISPELIYSKNDVKNAIGDNNGNLYISSVCKYVPHKENTNTFDLKSEYNVNYFFRRDPSQDEIFAEVESMDVDWQKSYASFNFIPIKLGDPNKGLKDITTISAVFKDDGPGDINYENILTNGERAYLFPVGFSQEILSRLNGGEYTLENAKGDWGHEDGKERDHSQASDTYVKYIPYESNDTFIGNVGNDFLFVDDVVNSQNINLTNTTSLYNTQYVVNGKRYIPYVFFQGWLRRKTLLAYRSGSGAGDESYLEDDEINRQISSQDWTFVNACPAAIGGNSMVFSFLNTPNEINNEYENGETLGETYLCNLRKPVNPYGGATYNARVNSVYYDYGILCTVANEETYEVLFDRGDCFLQCFEYQSAHRIAKTPAYHLRTFGVTYSIPVETDIDIYNDHGTTWSKHVTSDSLYMHIDEFGFLDHSQSVDNWSYIQKSPCTIKDGWYTQEDYQYLYNSAYSANVEIQLFASVDNESIYDLSASDCRTFYSELKEQNEIQDSWLKFKSANFLDVDAKYGAITALKNFNNQLIYWQERAVGGFSVNEKQLLENADGNNLIIGTGDVLQRYDYISTTYGMKPNQYAFVASDKDLYWWDEDKKELLSYRYSKSLIPSKGIVELGLLKSVKNYLNKLNIDLNHPLLTWDVNNQEVMFTVGGNETLTYNELLDVFTSIYKINPTNKVVFSDKLHLTTDETVYEWNTYQDNESRGFNNSVLLPQILAVVNTASTQTKVFDTIEFGGRFYGGGEAMVRKTPVYLQIQKADKNLHRDLSGLDNLRFLFNTPTKQLGNIDDTNIGKHLTNIEYDFKMTLPRNSEGVKTIGFNDKALHYGDRLKGKFMNYTLSSVSNNLDFTLQYIITKFRASWN